VSATIDVKLLGEERDALRFEVKVKEGGTATRHEVSVRRADAERLAPAEAPAELVRRSFLFLLEREPKEAILGRFDLTVIGRYFPEWEEAIRR
jgi:hypothetical protein